MIDLSKLNLKAIQLPTIKLPSITLPELDLSGIDAKAGNWTNDAFVYIGSASNLSAANANGAVWFENGVLYASTNNDTAAEFQIQLAGVTELLSTDLIL